MATRQVLRSHLRAYYDSLKTTFATNQATEHSYRSALETLIQGLDGQQVRALNEPKRIACGAPDFIVERGGVPIGHIECKDIGEPLDRIEKDPQLKRYRESLPNLILTDHLEFRWYAEGELRLIARLARIASRDRIAVDEAGASQVAKLFTAFFAADLPSIGRPRELAERMAAKARLLRDSIERILAQETDSPLHDLFAGYREVLIADLSEPDFADLQAQTAAYGLFAARCRHDPANGPFTRQSAAFAETTPFLRDVFGRIAGPGMDERIAWIVDDLAYLLDRADMASILSEFGKKTRGEDPVVHFYEDFLAVYDPHLREMRGVYYTPEPVVSYIVRSVDYLLRTRFGLADGLADTATVASQNGGSPHPRVLILDPAAGTGTFLREVVSTIRETIESKGLGGAWPSYVHEHLLPRLFGFELLMAPYSICHLKLALEIGDTDHGMPAGKRINVFLTNALEKAHEGPIPSLFVHEIAREATGADEIKREKPVMVILGNPPYSGHSVNNGEWIKKLLKGRDGEQTTGNYFEVDGQPLGEKNSKWLNDDYVKFIRFAQWRIERTGEGVLGFVTNHSYLDNPTFRGMRRSLMKTFDEIYLLDLHGNARQREHTPDGGKDENVFDIQQGVSISLFVKHKDVGREPCRLFHADLWGECENGPAGKYGWLVANGVDTTKWKELSPKSPDYIFVPRDEDLLEEYKTGWKVTDIFPDNSTGIVSKRDKIAFHFEQNDLYKVLNDFRTLDKHILKEKYNFKESRDGKIGFVKEHIQSYGIKDEYVKLCLYRPFDYRWTYYTDKSKGFLGWPVYKVMRHLLAGSNLGLCIGRAGQVTGSDFWDVAFVSKFPSDFNLFRRGGNCLFPLYIYPAEKEKNFGSTRALNLNPKFIEAVKKSTALNFIPDGPGDLKTTFGPENVFHYLYAVLHSPEYRRRYADFLKSDFPRVPVTNCAALFESLAALGKRLTALHLMETDEGEAPVFPVAEDNRVEKVSYAPSQKQVWINGKQYFDGISQQTWEFTIGGHQPAEKWLKDRKNRTLSYDDIGHYRRLCAALAETPRIMAKIDKTIDAYGGWPLVQDDYLRGLYQTLSEEWTSPEDEEAWCAL